MRTVALMMLTAAKAGWDAGMTALVNKEAAQLGATMLEENFLASVTRKPSSVQAKVCWLLNGAHALLSQN